MYIMYFKYLFVQQAGDGQGDRGGLAANDDHAVRQRGDDGRVVPSGHVEGDGGGRGPGRPVVDEIELEAVHAQLTRDVDDALGVDPRNRRGEEGRPSVESEGMRW